VTPAIAQPVIAPDLALPDHAGRTFRLSSRRGVGPTVIVFYRGHWCPYCRRYLAKLQLHREAFAQLRAQVVAISPEPIATSAMLARELALDYPLLSDPRGEVVDRYGARNTFTSATTVLPHATVVVVDADGFVRFKSVDRNFKKRTTMRTILNALREIQPQMNADERG
jgi:peroxiredoxin